MIKIIILNLGKGNLDRGFSQVKASLANERTSPIWQSESSLPASPVLVATYKKWKLLYQALIKRLNLSPRIEIIDRSIGQVSQVDFQQLSQQLKIELNEWLNSQAFLQNIEKPIYKKLREEDEINVIIQTDNLLLKQLPWHLWDFCDNFPKAEIALAAPGFDSPRPLEKKAGKVRILTILGDRTGIDIDRDCQILHSLSNVDLCFLAEPTRLELDEALRDSKGWDILFFAGHGRTEGETGTIAVNSRESLGIAELKNALKIAIDRGLQLAIFNSCEGFGLTKELEELHIPQTIVMSQIVPDRVAYTFLKYFLPTFAGGESLYLAVRHARERLQALETEYPCASWLPILSQNPAVTPLTWKALQGNPIPLRQGLKKPLVLSAICAAIVILARSLAWMQPLELKAYDFLMRLRPPEGVDPRLLLVTLTEEDVQQQPAKMRGSSSLSDLTLEQIFSKLEKSQAIAIGLDIYRENPVNKNYPALAERMKQSDRFFALCAYGLPGVVSPPEIPPERQGFNNILLDADDVLRRNLLAVESPEPCQNYYSLNFQLAKHYILQTQPNYRFVPNNANGYIQVGTSEFKTLDSHMGAYRNLDNRGHQILINYRNTPQIAETVTLMDFLERYPSEKIGKRIVLIGTVAPSFNDHRWYAPLGKMTGVEIQAHFVSQILSTVLDRRPLIRSLPAWGEILWIGGWSGAGAILARTFKSRRRFFGLGLAFIVLGISCWGSLLVGIWLPLVPCAIVLGITGSNSLRE
jgi:CHASE2 domain-containing sensor protein